MKHEMNKYLAWMLPAAILLTIFPFTDCWGYEDKRAKDNLSHEFIMCGTFYMIAAEGGRREGSEAGKALEKEASRAAELAFALADKYNQASEDVQLARAKLALEYHMETMRHDYANLALLIEQWGNLCRQAIENPDARLKYWLDKK